MLILFAKSQLALFDAPVNVAAHVRRDGTVVKPHTRIQKVALRQPSLFAEHHAAPAAPAAKRTKLDAFIDRHGGARSLAGVMAGLTNAQRQALVAKMAEVGKTTPEVVAGMLTHGAAAPGKGETPDMFADKQPEPVGAPISASEGNRLRDALSVLSRQGEVVGARYQAFHKRIGAAERGVPEAVSWAKEWLQELRIDASEKDATQANKQAEAQKRSDELRAQLLSGSSDNPRYQAFLDTVENLADAKNLNAEYMAWIDHLVSDFESKHGRISSENQSELFGDFVREYAGKHLSDRVKLGFSPRDGERNAEGLVFRNGRWHRESDSEQATPELVEHVTGKGKVLRGIVRRDIDGHAAAAIDPYTFKKNGGWFIREKYLSGEAAAAPAKADTPVEAEKRVEVTAKVDKSKQQAAKLRAGGEKLLADAQSDYGRDRNANTARRARIAAGAEADAAKRMRTAKTMINIANAIDDGEARYLTGITTRAAVETLERASDQAIYEADRQLSYVEQQRRKGRSLEPGDLEFATVPRAKWGTAGSSMTGALEAIKGKRGAPAVASQIRQASPYITPDVLAAMKKILGEKELNYHLGWWNIEAVARQSRLEKIGIKTDNDLKLALAELETYRDGHKPVDPIKAAERALVGQKVGFDFFPTPKTLAATMAELAGIKPGMRVLEPSAGNGHLADAARDAGADVDTVEISDALRNVLTAKKHKIVAHDFETFQPEGQYDAVIMNPPFSNRLDAAHIMRAWDMLKPGGRLVAIAGEGVFFGSDAKATAFRDWLGQHSADVEHLPENTFKGADLPAQTGANARLIVIEKPAEVAAAPVAEEGPKEGDRNADGLVFRDGRWHRDEQEQAALQPQAPEVEAAEDREDLATELARNPHSQAAKRMIADAGHRAASAEEPTEPDEDNPNSASYRYADTGYIAGSRKEMAASQVIKRAKADGAQVLVTGIDWEQLETNPREAKELITKSNLFGTVPWEQLRDGGMEPGAGFMIDRIYAAIGTEPSEDSPQARQDYTVGLQTLRNRLEACKTPAQVSDLLDELRDEYDGKVLNAEEADEYKKFSVLSDSAWREERKLREDQDKIYKGMIDIKGLMWPITKEIENRKRRGWQPKPELDAKLAPLQDDAEKAEKKYYDLVQANRPRMEQLEEVRRAAGRAMQSIQMRAISRNKIENPLHRAWTIMGDRFVNVLRFRSYKGSDAFAKHVAAAKAGRVKDWSWMEKEVTRAPKISKAGARFQLKVADTYKRIGGRDVTPESTMALKQMFGLRDVQSGNWVLNDPTSAKFHVENSAAAFADLADLLGVPDNIISFNGRLALAFGARGHGAKGFKDGAARADYSPVHRVINLTKMGGGGCLAHEWWHAIDNMIKEAEGGGASGVDDFASRDPSILPGGDLKRAYLALQSAMMDGPHKASETVTYTASDVALAKHNLQGYRVNTVGNLILSAGNASAAIDAIDKHFGVGADRKLSPKKKKLVKDWTRIAIAHYGGDENGGELVVRAGPPMSMFAHEAAKLDGSSTAYFSLVEEMSARAFQAWVEDRMAGMGRRNDYLSAWADNKYHVDPIFGIEWKPFPEGDERERINKAFDDLFSVMSSSGTLAKAMGLLNAGGL